MSSSGCRTVCRYLLRGPFFNLTEQLGARDDNGVIRPDFTEYFETVPSSRLQRLLRLESNRFANLSKILNQQRLDNQGGVVRHELPETVENKPYGRFGVLARRTSLQPANPDAHELLGSHRDLRSAARDFKNRYSKPDIAALVLAGDITLDKAVALATKYFGDWSGKADQAAPVPNRRRCRGTRFWWTNQERLRPWWSKPFRQLQRGQRPGLSRHAAARSYLWKHVRLRFNQNLREQQGIAYSAGSQTYTFSSYGARPERALFLVLCDREKIGTDMRDLGMGELKVIQ